jgi:hypothetical protein
MHYARREPRILVSCEVLVTPSTSSGIVGRLVDVSLSGAGLALPAPLARGTRVTITLVDGKGVLTARGVIRASRQATQSDAPVFRVGVGIDERPTDWLPRVTELAGGLAEGSGMMPVAVCLDQGGTAPLLASTGPGRERLYQHARERLAAGEPDEARKAALWAMQGDPRNPSYRTTYYLAAAEAALAQGDAERAGRELAKGLASAPEDGELLAVKARLRAPKKRGLLARLFTSAAR